MQEGIQNFEYENMTDQNVELLVQTYVFSLHKFTFYTKEQCVSVVKQKTLLCLSAEKKIRKKFSLL